MYSCLLLKISPLSITYRSIFQCLVAAIASLEAVVVLEQWARPDDTSINLANYQCTSHIQNHFANGHLQPQVHTTTSLSFLSMYQITTTSIHPSPSFLNVPKNILLALLHSQ